MSKYLSIIFSLLILLCGCNAYADEAETSDLLFDLDISAFSSENNTVCDKSGRNEAVTVKNIPASSTELIGENTIKYVVFNSESKDIVSNFKLEPTNICGLDNMTLEMYTKPLSDDNNRVIFSISKTNLSNGSYYASFTGNNLNVFCNDVLKSVDITDYIGKWGHYVFTRSYNALTSKQTIRRLSCRQKQ